MLQSSYQSSHERVPEIPAYCFNGAELSPKKAIQALVNANKANIANIVHSQDQSRIVVQ